MAATNHHETVVAEKMAAGGDAIAHLADGRVVFVDGALPGERVRVAVTTTKKDFAKGSVAEVLDASPSRVAPPCPALAAGCGGCQWQHVAPEAQVGLKTAIVEEALRRTGRLEAPEVREGGAVPAWAYRSTVRFAVAPDGRVGFRAGSSRRVVPVDGCPVAHPAIDAMVPGLRVRGAEEVTVRVSAATGECTVLPSDPRARVQGLPGGVAVGPEAVLHETVAGVSLRVSAASFFQSGPAAAELLVRTVREAAGDALGHGASLDAYGGIGLFAATLPLADATIVESSRSACADARVNVPAAEVVCSGFEDWSPHPVHLAVVDPARAGLGARGVEALVAAAPARVVLVSCDPVSLARDAALLTARGYGHRGSTVLDLFPNTPHVEVVTVFEPAAG